MSDEYHLLPYPPIDSEHICMEDQHSLFKELDLFLEDLTNYHNLDEDRKNEIDDAIIRLQNYVPNYEQKYKITELSKVQASMDSNSDKIWVSGLDRVPYYWKLAFLTKQQIQNVKALPLNTAKFDYKLRTFLDDEHEKSIKNLFFSRQRFIYNQMFFFLARVQLAKVLLYGPDVAWTDIPNGGKLEEVIQSYHQLLSKDSYKTNSRRSRSTMGGGSSRAKWKRSKSSKPKRKNPSTGGGGTTTTKTTKRIKKTPAAPAVSQSPAASDEYGYVPTRRTRSSTSRMSLRPNPTRKSQTDHVDEQLAYAAALDVADDELKDDEKLTEQLMSTPRPSSTEGHNTADDDDDVPKVYHHHPGVDGSEHHYHHVDEDDVLQLPLVLASPPEVDIREELSSPPPASAEAYHPHHHTATAAAVEGAGPEDAAALAQAQAQADPTFNEMDEFSKFVLDFCLTSK